MKQKTIKIELEEWQVEHMRGIVNSIKDFNRLTDDKGDITYDIICRLEAADTFLARHLGLEQPVCEHGFRSTYANYEWIEDEEDE